MDKEQLKEYLRENLRIEIVSKPNYTYNQQTWCFQLVLEGEVITSDTINVYDE